MSIELTSADGFRMDLRTTHPIERAAVLSLNDPDLTRRLDALFDEHFRRPRTPTPRVMVNHALKRGVDLLVATAALIVLWPVILISGIATLCETGRPMFYSQVRRIRFGRRARIYKMRTMHQGADRRLDDLVNIKNNGRFLNVVKAESSYTRVGRLLERLWIVELPQLWSVLKGEMSLVGNRPIPDYVIGALGPTHDVAERFAAPQGLTGYTQIIGRENVTDDERIALEHHYSRVFETGDVFLEDLRIIIITTLTYLGLAQPRSAEDFLGPLGLWAHSTGSNGASIGSNGHALRLATRTSTSATESEPWAGDGLSKLACPTCYEISGACDPAACGHECVTSCNYSAIRVDSGRAVIDAKCVACSACVHACPRDAIDKAPLTTGHAGLKCTGCGSTYPNNAGVYDLLPRRTNLEKSPYFDFYESEYVGDNPDVHQEDTDWKLRELRPLIKRDMHYRSMLDLGCGAGVLGRKIATELRIPDAVSADWSTQILGVARQAAPQGVYIRVDAAYLPLRNRSYDLALMIDVIEHQHKPDQVLSEVARVAENLLLRTPLEDCGYESLRRRRKDLFRESSGHVVHYNPATIRAQLASNGWSLRTQSIRHIAWTHWQRVLAGPFSFSARFTAAGRYGLQWLLPMALYRRLFVTNYNVYCTNTKTNGKARRHPETVGSNGTDRTPHSPQERSRPAYEPGRMVDGHDRLQPSATQGALHE